MPLQRKASGDALNAALSSLLAAAKVHATLALAASNVADADWFDVTSGRQS